MEINITKEALNVKKVVCEKKEIINIQGDMIVPDSKPDILNTISTSGNVCIYKKEVMEGKIKLDGNILAYIMYLADITGDAVLSTATESSTGENNRNDTMDNTTNNNIRVNNIRGLNTNLDFSETINIPELENEMNEYINPILLYHFSLLIITGSLDPATKYIFNSLFFSCHPFFEYTSFIRVNKFKNPLVVNVNPHSSSLSYSLTVSSF